MMLLGVWFPSWRLIGFGKLELEVSHSRVQRRPHNAQVARCHTNHEYECDMQSSQPKVGLSFCMMQVVGCGCQKVLG